MNFDLDKMQAAAELGEVIRLQNEALQRLESFRKSRPYLIIPNLAKMVEENLKENVQMLYKELNNLHKPPSEQKRHICSECKMAFATALPGGICDECRSRIATRQPNYTPQESPRKEEPPSDEKENENDFPGEKVSYSAIFPQAEKKASPSVDSGETPLSELAEPSGENSLTDQGNEAPSDPSEDMEKTEPGTPSPPDGESADTDD